MTPRRYTVLFLCTGNSARSIMAEVMMNRYGLGRFQAYSAGSHPTGHVNELAIETLQSMGFSAEGVRSKSWDEFAVPGAPRLDFVFTVCDNAAAEACPYWPGQPMTAHWGVPDPAAVAGSVEERRRAFVQAALLLQRRIQLFLSLPLASLDSLTLLAKLKEIGGTG